MIDEFFVRMMTELIEGMRTRAGQGARCMHVCVNLSSAAIGRSATRNGHLLLYFLFSLFNHLNMTRSGGSFMLLLIFSFFIVFFGLIQAQYIPQKFFGAFQLDHSDNWDAYLAAKGYDEQTRKTVKLPKITRILFPKEPGVYRMMVGTGLEGSRWVKGSKKNADWSFRLGSQFQAKYWDGNQHLILFTYDPTSDRLTERHTVVGSQAAPESFVYNINAEGNLDSHIMFNGVELIHHYIRTD